MKNMRPVMNEYSEQKRLPTNNQNVNNQKNQNTNTQPQNYNSNSQTLNKGNQIQNTQNVQNSHNTESTNNVTARAKPQTKKDYKIDPNVIPRPNFLEEVYKNDEKAPYYSTKDTTNPPLSNSFYITTESENSSCRLVRSTFSKIPTEQKIIDNSNLVFGRW